MNDWLIAIKLPAKKYLSYNETSLPSRVLCDSLSKGHYQLDILLENWTHGATTTTTTTTKRETHDVKVKGKKRVWGFSLLSKMGCLANARGSCDVTTLF